MIQVLQLEMDVAHACNLNCVGCTHYSNYSVSPAYIPFRDGGKWIRDCADRIYPRKFGFLGGEPALNPELNNYIQLAAEVWPDSERYLVSNGLLLHRVDGLLDVLENTKTALEVSLHSIDAEYKNQVNRSLAILAQQHGGNPNVKLGLRTSNSFYSTYQGAGEQMRPYEDENPRESWRICVNKCCKTIFDGKIWKCPPIAFLHFPAKLFDLYSIDEWRPYLEYKGLDILAASDEEIITFFSKREEEICGMCPTELCFHEALPNI